MLISKIFLPFSGSIYRLWHSLRIFSFKDVVAPSAAFAEDLDLTLPDIANGELWSIRNWLNLNQHCDVCAIKVVLDITFLQTILWFCLCVCLCYVFCVGVNVYNVLGQNLIITTISKFQNVLGNPKMIYWDTILVVFESDRISKST